MLSMSGHKIYGPKGIGVLYIKEGIKIEKIINGGHQEKDRRAGTENTAGIVGLGKAAELAFADLEKHIEKLKYLRNYYFNEIKKRMDNIKINGPMNARLPGNANISFDGVNATDLLEELDNYGICVSSGSACSSKDTKMSHVLTAIGVPKNYIGGTLRVTFGDFNTKEEVDYLIDNLVEIVERLRSMSPLYEEFLEKEK